MQDLLINVVIHTSIIQDSKGVKYVLEKLNSSTYDKPNLKQIIAYSGYWGKLIKCVKENLKMNMTVV